MQHASKYQIDPESLTLLRLMESSEDESIRSAAIDKLAKRGTTDSSRILIDTFKRAVWRSTKFTLLRAMGRSKVSRVVEFLCRIARDAEDLPMAAEAVLALGDTENPVAGEFLASIILKDSHPLAREALMAISNIPWFPCDYIIEHIVRNDATNASRGLMQNAVIAAGLRGQVSLLGRIVDIANLEKNVAGSALFNTCLITLGRIGNELTLDYLLKLDTRFRAFAHQLKIVAIESIKLRLGYSVEDAVARICSSENLGDKRLDYQMLRLFSPLAVREAFQLLAPDASIEQMALVLVYSPELSQLENDLAFLKNHNQHLSDAVFAALARTLFLKDKNTFLKNIVHDEVLTIRFLGLVYHSRSEKILFELITKPDLPSKYRDAAINAFTNQPLMQIEASDLINDMGKHVVKHLQEVSDQKLKSRLVRVLGQIGYSGADATTLFRNGIKDVGDLQHSIYAALTLSDTLEASKIICKRIKSIANNDSAKPEIVRAVEALSKFSAIDDTDALDNFSLDQKQEMKIPILKIMGLSKIPKLLDLIESGLKSSDFQEKLLAVAASRKYHSKVFSEILRGLLDHGDECIRGRALDSLTVAGSSEDHVVILQWLDRRRDDFVSYNKVFRCLVPEEKGNYTEFVGILDRLIASRLGVMNQQEILQMAINLRDNLMAGFLTENGGQKGSKNGSNNVSSTGTLSLKDQHAIDETLKRDLIGYGTYSETIKSVLRSGEAICQHPELFDARVDKSTVLIQYVKSIDLLFQANIGSVLFLQQNNNLMQSMQSRLVRLDLDGDFGSSATNILLSDMQLTMFFSSDTFPTHKLFLICRSIMSGQIMKEQYRAIDGLRAWAILLLLFGRSFRFRNCNFEPLFPLKNATSDKIVKIARDMNDLQEARNKAAHRATMLEMGNLHEMRLLCTSVLNSLRQHFA